MDNCESRLTLRCLKISVLKLCPLLGDFYCREMSVLGGYPLKGDVRCGGCQLRMVSILGNRLL